MDPIDLKAPREFCCRFHPEARMLLAYIPVWPFRAEFCETCGSVNVYWGGFVTLLWAATVGWWWDGRMKICEDLAFLPSWRRTAEK